MKIIYKSLLVATLLIPAFASAQNVGKPITDALGVVASIISLLYGLLPVVAVLAFFVGIAVFVWQKMIKGKGDSKVLIWGVVGLAVLFSLYGIIRILQQVVGAGATAALPAPAIPRPGR